MGNQIIWEREQTVQYSQWKCLKEIAQNCVCSTNIIFKMTTMSCMTEWPQRYSVWNQDQDNTI